MADDPDTLVTLVTTNTEFEAHSIVVVLEDVGIDARAFGAAHRSLPLSSKYTGVPVQVRQADLDAARLALEQARLENVDRDWDDVDVGDPEPPADPTTHTVPIAARVGFIVAVIAALIAFVGFLVIVL